MSCLFSTNQEICPERAHKRGRKSTIIPALWQCNCAFREKCLIMANTRKAGNDRRSQDQDNLRTQQGSKDQQNQNTSGTGMQNSPSEQDADLKRSGKQRSGEMQNTSNTSGSSGSSGSSIKRGSERDRSSSGLRDTNLDSSTQHTSGQQFSDQTGREESSDR